MSRPDTLTWLAGHELRKKTVKQTGKTATSLEDTFLALVAEPAVQAVAQEIAVA